MQRLMRVWLRGGQPSYEKAGWGNVRQQAGANVRQQAVLLPSPPYCYCPLYCHAVGLLHWWWDWGGRQADIIAR